MSRDPKRPSDDRESSGAKAVVLVLGVLVTLAAGGYAVAGAVAGDKVPRGTTIAGVDIGGRSPARAERTLVAGLDERLAEPLSIKVPGAGTREIDPALAGLSVDTPASVAEAGGRRSWAPDRLWDFFTGGEELDPVVDVDESALDEALAGLAEEVDQPAVDGQVKLTTNGVKTTKPETGRELDLEASRAALVAAYVDQAGGEEGATTELEVTEVEPDIDAADVDRAVEEFANPAMSAPVSLDFGDASVTLDPQQYAPVVRLKAVDGALEPAVKTKKLAGLVDSATAGDGAPVDATVALVDGKPRWCRASPAWPTTPATSATRCSRSSYAARASAASRSRRASRSPTSPPRTPASCRSASRSRPSPPTTPTRSTATSTSGAPPRSSTAPCWRPARPSR